MSVEAIAVALHHSRAKGTDKLVLLGIANHAGDGGAWPSHETLARYGNCSITRVKQAIKALVALGEVSVEVRAGGNADMRNDRRPNRYHVLLACPEGCDGSQKHRTTVTPSACREDGDGGQKSDARQALLRPTGDTPSTQEPSFLEPSSQNLSASQSQSAGDTAAKRWWEEQTPRPAGKGAWWSLLTSCRAVAERGWKPDEITAALNRIGRVPTVGMLDAELRRPRRHESNRERQLREGIEDARRLAGEEEASVLALFGSAKELGR